MISVAKPPRTKKWQNKHEIGGIAPALLSGILGHEIVTQRATKQKEKFYVTFHTQPWPRSSQHFFPLCSVNLIPQNFTLHTQQFIETNIEYTKTTEFVTLLSLMPCAVKFKNIEYAMTTELPTLLSLMPCESRI